MRDDSWFPWFPTVFKRATAHLTPAQDGLYRRLIDYYMETREPLPDNEIALARICGVSVECFKDASSILRAFFKEKDGLLFHDFCDNQLDLQDKRSRKRSEIASKAANARHKKNKLNQEHDCIKHTPSNASPLHKRATGQDRTGQDILLLSKDNNRGKLKNEFVLPDWIPKDLWDKFLEHRKKNKSPMTPYAQTLAIKELEKLAETGNHPIEVINQTIARGWKGFFELKQNQKGNYQNGKTRSQLADEAAERALARLNAMEEYEQQSDSEESGQLSIEGTGSPIL